MYFDRFDICEAYFMYMMLWNRGGLTERDWLRVRRSISSQLATMRFKPSPMLSDESDLTENGREIYENLVSTYENRQ